MQQNLVDIFEDCIRRMSAGQTIDDCLRSYPGQAARLRPLLATAETVRAMGPLRAELVEDQALVWQRIQTELPSRVARRRAGMSRALQVLLAAAILMMLLAATWLVLSRPDQPDQIDIIIPAESETPVPSPTETLTATATTTAIQTTATPTATSTQTETTTPTSSPSATATQTVTPAPTSTPRPTVTSVPAFTFGAESDASATPTFVPGCGAPLTEADARSRVLAIYPNAVITSIQQMTKFGGTLVWEVKTDHGATVNVDVACGTILTIEQQNRPNPTAQPVTNPQQPSSDTGSDVQPPVFNGNTGGGNSGSNNGGSGESGSSDNGGNSNPGSGGGTDSSGSSSDDGGGDDSSGSGSDDSSGDDNSGMGSDDRGGDDNSGMGSSDDGGNSGMG